MQIEITNARASEFNELMDFMHLCFLTKRAGHERFETLFADVYEQTEQSMSKVLLARCNGRLVGAVTASSMPIIIAGAVIEIGAIGGVCTHPDFRGQGMMGTLMDAAMERLRETYAIAWLSGDRQRYARWGFEKIPCTVQYEIGPRGPGISRYKGLGFKIERLSNIEAGWADIWKMVSAVPYFAVCGEEMLRKKFARRSRRSSCIWLASNGRQRGFVYAFEDLGEVFAWGGDCEAVGAIISSLVCDKLATINMINGANDAFARVFEQICVDKRIVSRGNIAILDAQRAIQQLKPAIESQIAESVICEKELDLKMGQDRPWRLAVSGKSLITGEAQDSSEVLALTSAELAVILMSHDREHATRLLPGNSKWMIKFGPVPFFVPPLYNI